MSDAKFIISKQTRKSAILLIDNLEKITLIVSEKHKRVHFIIRDKIKFAPCKQLIIKIELLRRISRRRDEMNEELIRSCTESKFVIEFLQSTEALSKNSVNSYRWISE